MSTATAWDEYAKRELQLAGHRSGGARQEVVGLLGRQDCLLSAHEIHDALRSNQRQIGLASVYRALDVLTSLRLLHRVDVDGTACYEPALPSGEHHHHAMCSACGRLEPFSDSKLEDVIHELGDRLGYDLQAHDVVLRGACRDCRAPTA